VFEQVVDALRPLLPTQVVWGCRRPRAGTGGVSRNRDHSAFDELAKRLPASNPSARDRSTPPLAAISTSTSDSLAEGCDQRLQQDRHHRRAREGATARTVRCPRSAQTLARRDQLLMPGFFAPRKESFAASVRPTLRVVRMNSTAPTRTPQGCAPLADRRRCHPEFSAALRKLRVQRNAQNPSRHRARPAGLKFCFIAHRHYRG